MKGSVLCMEMRRLGEISLVDLPATPSTSFDFDEPLGFLGHLLI